MGKSAAEKALDDIANICGCPHWDYPGQVVRDVKLLVEHHAQIAARLRHSSACAVSLDFGDEGRKCDCGLEELMKGWI